MTNEEYKKISEAIEKCKESIVRSFDKFNEEIKHETTETS